MQRVRQSEAICACPYIKCVYHVISPISSHVNQTRVQYLLSSLRWSQASFMYVHIVSSFQKSNKLHGYTRTTTNYKLFHL